MSDSLTIIDNRTGKKYELPIQDGTIRAMDLRQIKTGADDFGLMTYDPAFMNTANCRSSITYIDGDKGILLYRKLLLENLEKVERGEDPMGVIRDPAVNEPMISIARGSQYDAFGRREIGQQWYHRGAPEPAGVGAG